MSPLAENTIRLSAFLSVLTAMAVWEAFAPRRTAAVRKPLRWANNLALVVLNTVLMRLVVPVTAAGAAVTAESHQIGILHHVALPAWVEFVIALLVFDLVIYLQHVMFHAIPRLWRLHLVHHADLDVDVTTGLRFHSLEILLSMLIKLATVAALGPSPAAVVIFEVLLNAMSMFNHANVHLGEGLDRALRRILVTPDMHRVHHSVLRPETNSNFGFNLSWWDYLFGTYRAQPEAGHERMTIGVAEHRDEREVERLPGMLLLPFARDAVEQPPNREAPGEEGAKASASPERPPSS